jgi:hypothetical protein
MRLLFIHGPAASGKLTVAKAVCAMTGMRLFHNHLVVDALLAVFQFGSPEFVTLRESMWLGVFEAAAGQDISLAFTFAPESTVRPEFIAEAVHAVEKHGGEVCFVELQCPIEEIERRLDAPSRREWMKLKSVATFRELRSRNADSFPTLPAGLTLDTSAMTPEEAARRICERYGIPVQVAVPRNPYA